MRIAVCLKYSAGEWNPFDASALECALRMEGAEVIALAMAPPAAEKALEQLTRLGVARGVLLTDPLFAGGDTLATSYVLSLAIARLKPDLVLCGRQSMDGDTGQVGPSLACLLGLSVVAGVLEAAPAEEGINCRTRDGMIAVRLPSLMLMERSYSLRFPGLRSRPGTVERWDAAFLEADSRRCGLAGSPTRVLKTWENQSGKRTCRFLAPHELLPLVEELRQRQQVQPTPPDGGMVLEEVWTVGEETAEKAQAIARKVTRIPRTDDIRAIVELIREGRPAAVLWPSDPWGRLHAPQAAALLQTGLCADCTHLETDGKRLFMYRPAWGGHKMAKIACLTEPQMATVRIVSPSSDILVAGGKGVAPCYHLLRQFAEGIGGQPAASRGLVDAGLAPYSAQVGLTGLHVSPKIYIAAGISGAVHHTCAIEGAGTVIAINPDRKARIFDYADYGINAAFSEELLTSILSGNNPHTARGEQIQW
ncbi:MAG: electron transfer flavoprotein alpha/beta subunit [Paenibacillaceae bacterium]|nr:electron transfer flavoprotein alpha/beta subunit [Paenibacillaceae bacterium]